MAVPHSWPAFPPTVEGRYLHPDRTQKCTAIAENNRDRHIFQNYMTMTDLNLQKKRIVIVPNCTVKKC